jgi:hypothetical protein
VNAFPFVTVQPNYAPGGEKLPTKHTKYTKNKDLRERIVLCFFRVFRVFRGLNGAEWLLPFFCSRPLLA